MMDARVSNGVELLEDATDGDTLDAVSARLVLMEFAMLPLKTNGRKVVRIESICAAPVVDAAVSRLDAKGTSMPLH